ncbi:MAG: tRNA preQ1(34) S-adenosylmethionine ribosyltransferase-isomerase QueA [Acidobacteria bacterium]|nr:tRNA preQ1(34) S-adenosylmethionine ribosyltransferase-isomerase QueA [Acidobacteriota bacterium]
MQLSDFDYPLPRERIAQRPLGDRAASRMLVLDRAQQRWEDRAFRELPQFLRPGDCLVLNDSKVFPSRLFGYRAGVRALRVGKKNAARKLHLKGQVEVLLLRPHPDDPSLWQALVRPGRKMHLGERVRFGEELEAEVVARGELGERTLRLRCQGDLYESFERIGHMPLPPYIKRPDEVEDRQRYQTVYAQRIGSVAAPTAGLHFTPAILEECRAAGADIARVTLHVGLGTFQPIHTETVEDHHLHAEVFEMDEDNARRLRAAQRLVAVGTTSVRTLETVAGGQKTRDRLGCPLWTPRPVPGFSAQAGLSPCPPCRGETSLFIYPGFRFQATGAMLTNFHLPRSSLLVLVCAFAGRELVLEAYRHAIEAGYRFYSYGDCMLIL